MNAEALELLARHEGVATTRQLLTVMTRQQLDVQIRNGGLIRVWRGVYACTMPDLHGRLAALDMFMGQLAVASMGTAAALDPGVRMRSNPGLTVHQRSGAPVQWVASRPATAPAWTAVEVARQLRRPRALATLDAALHSGWCTVTDIEHAVLAQRGRVSIVTVRELLQIADGRAESGMESEARLVMLDHGLPAPELQYTIRGLNGQRWRVDFAWPHAKVAAEYESVQWHAGRAEMVRDKARFAGVQEVGWTMVPIIVDDVRVWPARLAGRINSHLERGALPS